MQFCTAGGLTDKCAARAVRIYLLKNVASGLKPMGAGHHKLIGKTGSNRVRAFVLTSQPAQMSFSLSLGNGGGGLTSCEGRSQMICSGEALTKRRSIISCVDFYLDLYRLRDSAQRSYRLTSKRSFFVHITPPK